ncbi:hypothetical protein G6011_11445 [Alternaria panax]|uniref:Heterokaryon incompatibility domain-containing protein n=1 Tax=Alternaria panax TaxID=48097 RepID=A0AAD4NPX9_9PLEO|nr:hypothetical protein G6011_11445 [Alternaria panax]
MAPRILSKLKRRAKKTTGDIYVPLDAKSRTIRLLHLRPGVWEDNICAELQVASIARVRKRYITISYMWGSEGVARQVLIMCNGKPVSISENLFTALRKLRRPDHAILLWADALCINQVDPLERTQQVGIMGEIYSNSCETIIWLGEIMLDEEIVTRSSNDYTSKTAWKGDQSDNLLRNTFILDFERSCAAEPLVASLGSSLAYPGPDIFGAFCLIQDFAEGTLYPLLKLLDRNRTTILDRIEHPRRHALTGTNAHWRQLKSLRVWEGLKKLMGMGWWQRIWVVQETVLSGNATVHYGPLSAPWSMFARAAENYVQQRHTLCLDLAGTRHGQDILDQFSDLVLRIEQTRLCHCSSSDTATLLDLLWKFRPLQATDKRDKVFALFGLTTDWQNLPALVPDYSNDTATTFTQTTLSNLLRAGSLSVLAGDLEAVLNRKRLEGLPSWVMDWSLPCLPTEIERVGSLYMYNASEDHDDSFLYHPKNHTLEVEAVYIDNVSTIGEVSRHTQINDTCAVIRAWKLLTKAFEPVDKIYPTGEPCEDVFWRTLIGDLIYTGTAPNARETQGSYRRATNDDYDAFEAWRMWSRCISRDTMDRTAPFDLDEGISGVHHALKTATASRRFFLTSTGYMGIGPRTTVKGDKVYVFKGSKVPFIVRGDGPVMADGDGGSLTRGDASVKNGSRLIGDCFVYGLMDGEAFSQESDLQQFSA